MRQIKKIQYGLFYFFVCLVVCSVDAATMSVNGKAIDQNAFEYNVKANLERGLQDSQNLRDIIKDEMITKEILYQKAMETKAYEDAVVKIRLDQAKKNVLAEIVLENYTKNNPVSAEDVKREYEKQSERFKGADQFNLKAIVVQDKEKADDVQKKLTNGEDFNALAKTYSIDNSKINGGDLGWVLPENIIGPVSNVMVNLSKGSVSKQPIQTQMGWYVIKVENKRPFQMPTFEDEKLKIEMFLKQKKKMDYIKSLKSVAKVVQ
jgi:peptidyl-prolyl cis-trans isomerase C